jgi:hypothetical protein
MNRLAERAKRKNFVELLPLPTGPKDLGRLKRLFRWKVFSQYYDRASIPEVAEYLSGPMKVAMQGSTHYVDEQIAAIGRELEQRPHWVFPNRERDWAWDDRFVPPPPESAEPEITVEQQVPPPRAVASLRPSSD